MTKVIGVRFRTAGKIYFFSPGKFEVKRGDQVIVETARGVEFGNVVMGPKEVKDEEITQPLKTVIRLATEDDRRVEEKNRKKEKEAFQICLEKIHKHGLEMKLIDAEYTFDNNKVLFYFTADGRIDFRELVKDLASVFRTRIELRQIGVRDETKMLGGIGICGRELCCKSYLTDFVPVSIKMAKEQNLSLNPTKISGVCGRLMCCLKNEQDTYEYLNSRLPSVGDYVTTPGGMKGEVQSINVLRQLVKVIVDNGEEKELIEYPVDDLQFTPKRRKDVKVTEEELKELEGLEDSGTETAEEEKPERPARNNYQQRDNQNRGNRYNQNNRGDRYNQNNRGEREDRRQNNRDRRNDSERSNDHGNQGERSEQNRHRNNGRYRRNYDRRNNQDGPNRGEQNRSDNS